MKERCPVCNELALDERSQLVIRNVGDHRFVRDVRLVRCAHCYFSPIPVDSIALFELDIAVELATCGPRDNVTFRFMRRAMGVCVEDAGRVVDASPAVVRAWEARRAPIPLDKWLLFASVVITRASLPHGGSLQLLGGLRVGSA